jgi:hypothetical protein
MKIEDSIALSRVSCRKLGGVWMDRKLAKTGRSGPAYAFPLARERERIRERRRERVLGVERNERAKRKWADPKSEG